MKYRISKKVIMLSVLAAVCLIAVVIAVPLFLNGNSHISLDKMVILANAFAELDKRDPLAADSRISVDCGIISLKEDVKFYRWKREGESIFAVDYGIGEIYFNDHISCDAEGNILSESEPYTLDIDELIGAALYLYENSSSECVVENKRYGYTLELDEQTMKDIAYAIAPDAEKYNVNFKSGNIIASVFEGKIESIEFVINGEIDLYLTVASASFAAKLEFDENNSVAVLPEKVIVVLEER